MENPMYDRESDDRIEEDDELLWKELKDDDESHSNQSDQQYRHGNHSDVEALPTVDMPSLRANIHLPAISKLFHDVVDTARASLTSNAAAGGTAPSSSPGRPTYAPDNQGRVENLDAFLINLYNYYYHRGFWSIFVVETVSLATGLFSVVLSTFLFGCIQWHDMIDCHDDPKRTCTVERYVSCSAEGGVGKMIIGLYFLLFVVYWLFRLVQLIGTLRDARAMGAFYTDRLHIDARQVQSVKWDEIVSRVLALVDGSKQLKQASNYRLHIDSAALSSPHDFARRIMRRENYLIACMNQSLFTSQALLPPAFQFASATHVMLSRNMEANMNICLIDQLFDGQHRLARDFVQDPKVLQKRFVVAGVLNLLLTPFLLIYRASRFFLLSAQEWNASKSHYPGTRRWSNYALWKFREYNELPHVLDARIDRSYPLAENYLSLFPAGPSAILAGGISFCASSLMAVLLGMSLVEESLLMETTLFGRQLVWYLTICTTIFVVSRSFTTSSPALQPYGDCDEAMMQLAGETHHFPKEWRGRCHSFDVQDEFLSFFPFKAVLFVQECLSVLMAPYILCFSLPKRAREILVFIRSHSLALPHAGAVCRFGEFDFKEYGNDAKMESSFLNFKQNHPQWVGGSEGEALLQRLGRFQEDELQKSSMNLGDSVMDASHQTLSLSQQMMQSQAIQHALGGGLVSPQSSQFYWLEKLHQQGPLTHMRSNGQSPESSFTGMAESSINEH